MSSVFSPIETISIFSESRKLDIVIPLANFCHCRPLTGFAPFVQKTTEKRRGIHEARLPRFESTSLLSYPLEVAFDLFFKGIQPASIRTVRTERFERLFLCTDALPVFIPEVPVSEVFMFYSHMLQILYYEAPIA